MNEAHIEQRLKILKTELEAAQKVLAELEAKEFDVRQTVLRLSGAIQVLEEELSLNTFVGVPSKRTASE